MSAKPREQASSGNQENCRYTLQSIPASLLVSRPGLLSNAREQTNPEDQECCSYTLKGPTGSFVLSPSQAEFYNVHYKRQVPPTIVAILSPQTRKQARPGSREYCRYILKAPTGSFVLSAPTANHIRETCPEQTHATTHWRATTASEGTRRLLCLIQIKSIPSLGTRNPAGIL